MSESIYNLVPREYSIPAKEPMYRSAHNPDAIYPGSTFGMSSNTGVLIIDFDKKKLKNQN